MTTETGHGTGGLKSSLDLRDRKYHRLARATTPFDWSKGFSAEDQLKTKLRDKDFKIKPKDQGRSSSCGGQAMSYYEAVQDTLEKMSYTEKSAKDIYSQVFDPRGGSEGRKLMELLVKKGVCYETLIPSYNDGVPPEEPFMRQRLQTPATVANATTAKGYSYAKVKTDMESLAIACRDNNGLMLGVDGENNGTWRSTFPKPPKELEWRHWVFVVGAKLINGKKYLEIINSWGNVGDKGHQFLGEDYVPHFFEAWTLYDDYGIYQPTYSDKIRAIIQKLLVELGITK